MAVKALECNKLRSGALFGSEFINQFYLYSPQSMVIG